MIQEPLIKNTDLEETTFNETGSIVYVVFIKDFSDKIKMKFTDTHFLKGIYTDKIRAINEAKNYDLPLNSDFNYKKILSIVVEYREGILDKTGLEIPNGTDYKDEKKAIVALYLNGTEIDNKEHYSEYLTSNVKNKNFPILKSCSIM